jgi:hypothetical protein
MFDRAYIINLPQRKDRRNAVTKEFKRAGLPINPGKVELFPGIKPATANGFPNVGAHGCFLSHLAALEAAIDDGLQNVLIAEDDVTLAQNFTQHIEEFQSHIGSQWGIAYLGHREPEGHRHDSPGFIQLNASRGIETTHLYAVNGWALPRVRRCLLEIMNREPGDPLGGPMHYDGALSTIRAANPDIATFIATPNLGWQRSSKSDITSSWKDRFPINLAAEAYRFAKNLQAPRRAT